MASITRNHLYTVDLNKPLTRQSCGILLAEGDNNGDCFSFELVRDGMAVIPGGALSVTAYFIRDDGKTVFLTGESSNINRASVTLPQSCYIGEGRFSLAVKVAMDGVTTTIAVLDGYIKNTQSDTLIDPGSVVPSLDELFAQIAAMEQATAAANTAANNAKEFIVTVTVPQYIIDGDMSGITSDKTYAEIRAAITAGKTPVVKLVTKGKAETEILHLYSFAPVSIIFRQHMRTPSTYNVSGSHQLTFVSTGSITLSSVNIKSVPDGGTDGQVLVHKGESTYEWRDPSAIAGIAPAIIPTATGEVVTIPDSAHRPLAGLRLCGKTTQNGTPSPSAPVPLVNVGAGGSIGVKARGKNLVDAPDVTLDKAGYPVLYAQVSAPEGYYTLSFASDTAVRCQATWRENLPVITAVTNARTVQTFYATGGIDTFSLYITGAATITDIQLEAGAVATAFEPYKDGGSLTASTVGGLPGIPVSNGGNYTDASGQMWLCDEIDFARGVYVQRIGKYTFTGQEVTQVYGAMNVNGYGRYQILMLGADAAYVGNDKAVPSLCTGYEPKGATELAYLINNDKTGYYFAFITVAQMAFSTNAATIDAFRAEIAGTTIMYQLATPVETPLSTSELAAFRAMTSQKPTTTVYNDAGAGLGVDYIADTKNYIDQRISALLNA